MARPKEYIEENVLEKAMLLFWQNGYRNTSLRMLSKEMGINQFSINASFGNKESLFRKAIQHYLSNLNELVLKLEASNEADAIKKYFFDFVAFSTKDKINKGCLLANTMNEISVKEEPQIHRKISEHLERIRKAFDAKLAINPTKSKSTILKQSNYLIISLQGLVSAAKTANEKQLEDFIELTFNHL